MTLSALPFLHHRSDTHAVLLVHGLGGGPYEVQRLGEHLATVNQLTVQGVLLPGHGEARRRMPASSWPRWFDAVEQAYGELAARYRRVQVVGFSTGAVVVLKLALERKLTEKVVLMAPFLRVYRPTFSPVRPEALVKAMRFLKVVPRRAPPLRDVRLRAEVARCAGYKTFSLEATRSALELIAEVTGRLSEVRAPALVIQGARDTVVDPSGAEFLVSRLGARAQLLRLPESNHLVTLDVNASLAIEGAAAFLTGESAQRNTRE